MLDLTIVALGLRFGLSDVAITVKVRFERCHED